MKKVKLCRTKLQGTERERKKKNSLTHTQHRQKPFILTPSLFSAKGEREKHVRVLPANNGAPVSVSFSAPRGSWSVCSSATDGEEGWRGAEALGAPIERNLGMAAATKSVTETSLLISPNCPSLSHFFSTKQARNRQSTNLECWKLREAAPWLLDG